MVGGGRAPKLRLASARVLLTGATGMVGRRLLDELHARGATVATLGRRPPSGGTAPHFTWDAAGDGLPAAAAAWAVDAVIHAAAITDVDACEAHPKLARRINVAATAAVAEEAARAGARLLYLSTAAVFDGRRGGYADEDPPNPVNVYGRTKLGGEAEALRVAGSLVLRFNVVGAERLTSWILSSAARREPISVFTDVLFNPVEARDLAQMLCALCESDLTGVCHLGSDATISKAEYAERLIACAGLGGRARVTRARLADAPQRAPRPLNTSLLVSPRVLNVAPPPSLEAAIRRLAAGFNADQPALRGWRHDPNPHR